MKWFAIGVFASYALVILHALVFVDISAWYLYGGVLIFMLSLYLIPHPVVKQFSLCILTLFVVSYLLQFSGIVLKASIFGPDKILHLLGGVILGYFSFTLLKQYMHLKIAIACAILFTLAIGAGWEVFEWILFSFIEPELLTPLTYTDSMLDIIFDSLGGVLGTAVSYFFLK